MKRIFTLTFAATGIALLVVAFQLGRSSAAQRTSANVIRLPVGHETAPAGGMLSSGWAVPNSPGAFATSFDNLQSYLGGAIGPNNGVTQDFYFGQLVRVPSTSPQAQDIELQSLGREHALVSGLQLTPQAEPDPMVQRMILEAAQTGYDPQQLFGRVITPVLCDQASPQHCRQYTDKQLVAWTVGDATAHREPLGCLLNQQCNLMLYPIQHPESTAARMLPFLGGSILLLLALGTLVFSRLREAGFVGNPVDFHGS
jgi:hypothetical protein